MLTNWLRTDLMTQVNSLMSNLTVGIFNVISEVFNMLIGVIVSVYILYSKEIFARQCKKAVYALFRADRANMVLHITTKSNEIFGGFVIGKILDSAIIGLLCFIGLTILNMPYTMLVSVIVGVTNVIPFFGPYIGAIPSTILIALEDPMKGVYFLIFILVLQQFDGNILGPKILGNSTGLSAFWVVTSILLGGGLFGFVGMVMGVPTFAVIYYIVDMILDNKLKKKRNCLSGQIHMTNGVMWILRESISIQKRLRVKQRKNKKKAEGSINYANCVQNDLPVKEILEKENIFVMDEHRATHQDIRLIKIGLLNLMPLKEDTELQILRSLSNTPLQIDVTFVAVSSHESKNTSSSHLNKFYEKFSDIKRSEI